MRNNWVVTIFLAICFMAVLLFLLISQASSHENYSGIRNKNGVLCCDGQDCHRIVHESEIKIVPSGGYVVIATGEAVDEGHVADSPNGEWHICRVYDGPVRCLMIPPGGM